MKKIMMMAALALTASVGFAQWQSNEDQNWNRNNNNNNQQASLIITTQSQRQVYVTVDNNAVYQNNGNNGYGNSFNVGSLYAGNHSIVVYELRKNIFGKERQEIIYSSSVYLKAGYETTILVNGYGQATTSERVLYNNNNNGQYSNNGNGRGYGYGRKKNKHKQCGNDKDDDRRRGQGNRNDNDGWDN
jgi:hypothetical protein